MLIHFHICHTFVQCEFSSPSGLIRCIKWHRCNLFDATINLSTSISVYIYVIYNVFSITYGIWVNNAVYGINNAINVLSFPYFSVWRVKTLHVRLHLKLIRKIGNILNKDF